MDTLTLTRPDDWHLHVRDGAALRVVVPHTARQFARAILMPNLRPPVTTAAQALEYKQRILAAVPAGVAFEPLMTLYLTDNTPPAEIARAAASGFVKAVKLYPAGATTNSDAGLTDIAKAYATLAEMERAPKAKLNLIHCYRSMNYISRHMEEKYGMPWMEYNFFGPTKIAESLRKIAAFFDDKIQENAERVIAKY